MYGDTTVVENNSKIGVGSVMGPGSKLKDGIHIGDNSCVVGGGVVVNSNLANNSYMNIENVPVPIPDNKSLQFMDRLCVLVP